MWLHAAAGGGDGLVKFLAKSVDCPVYLWEHVFPGAKSVTVVTSTRGRRLRWTL